MVCSLTRSGLRFGHSLDRRRKRGEGGTWDRDLRCGSGPPLVLCTGAVLPVVVVGLCERVDVGLDDLLEGEVGYCEHPSSDSGNAFGTPRGLVRVLTGGYLRWCDRFEIRLRTEGGRGAPNVGTRTRCSRHKMSVRTGRKRAVLPCSIGQRAREGDGGLDTCMMRRHLAGSQRRWAGG